MNGPPWIGVIKSVTTQIDALIDRNSQINRLLRAIAYVFRFVTRWIRTVSYPPCSVLSKDEGRLMPTIVIAEQTLLELKMN